VFAPPPTTLEAVVRVAGSRWTVESSFEAAQGEVGLEQYAVRSGTAWDRPSTRVMWAVALLTVMRAGTMAVDMFKKSLRSPTQTSPRAPFKATRGLASPGVSPSGGGCDGASCWPSPKRSATC